MATGSSQGRPSNVSTPHPHQSPEAAGSDRYTDADPFLVGISPQYWAHAPMHISDIHHLKLVNGINCWRQGDDDLVPVSKCLLVGYVVNAVIRGDGSTAYVIDDGTGLIDCFMWTNDEDIFSLPSLQQEDLEPKIQLGDLVRIFGKINNLSVVENQQVVREIQASVMEQAKSSSLGRSLDDEARHWMACANLQLSTQQSPKQHNALGYLETLGPQIKSQVNERSNLPKADDTLGSWRVFGLSCRCKLDYMERLLYCHCKAKVEPQDPHFVFRDEVIALLLFMQDTHEKKLVFTYKEIKSHPRLRKAAANQAQAPKSSKLNLFLDRLFLNTFRALRHDGIIYLMDPTTDQYLFITREKVLEPFVRSETMIKHANQSKNFINFKGAPFLSKVHHERILFIKRSLKAVESVTWGSVV